MWAAASVILWLVAAMLALLLAILVSPLRIEFRSETGKAAHYSLALRPFGRFGPGLTLADSKSAPRDKKEKPKKMRKKRRLGARRDPRRIIRAAIRLIAEIVGQLHIEELAVDLRFGAEDPAETGEIFGMLTPLIHGTSCHRRMHVTIEPVFDAALFDGRAALDITLTPARLLPPLFRFGWAMFGPVR